MTRRRPWNMSDPDSPVYYTASHTRRQKQVITQTYQAICLICDVIYLRRQYGVFSAPPCRKRIGRRL